MSFELYHLNRDVAVSLLSINNEFYQRIANLAKNLALRGQFLDSDFNSEYFPENDNQSVISLLRGVPPFYQIEGNNTLLDELAYVRWCMGFSIPDASKYEWSERTKEAYALDYILSTSLCLVEIFSENGGHVDKMLATRSPLIATIMNQDYEGTKIAKLEQSLFMSPTAYSTFDFRLLKLNPNRTNGFRIVVPKKTFNLKGKVKITPVAISTGFNSGIQDLLQNNILKFTYMKDNLTFRELISTLNMDILHTYYEPDYAQKAILNRKANLARGYMPIPELGLSKYDESGTRALNFTRIKKIEYLSQVPQDIMKYVDVDFDRVVPAIKEGIEYIQNIDTLRMVYYELKGEEPSPSMDFYSLKHTLLYFIDMAKTVMSTTAERNFHDYMLTRPDIFPNYNNNTPVFQPNLTFNMGLLD